MRWFQDAGAKRKKGIDFVWQSRKDDMATSDILCDDVISACQSASGCRCDKAEKIRVTTMRKKVALRSGLLLLQQSCVHGGACVQKDDMADILQKMIDADVIVLASPVYFYSISAQ